MKRIYLFFLLLVCNYVLYAQSYTPPSFADIDNNYRNYVNNVFGALEPNRVSTGLLADYGFDFTGPGIYNGSVPVDSTLMEQGIYSNQKKERKRYWNIFGMTSSGWMLLNEKVFQSTGKMMEKYNVENTALDSGGGEYPTQDGFGWSNGVYLKFYSLFRK